MARQPKLKPLAAAIALAFGSETALAQAQPEQALPEVQVRGTPDSGFRTDSTRGATRTETPLRDIPQFVNTVPEAVIRSQGVTSLQDALRNVPGITFTAPEGGVQAAQIFWLRGFQAGGDLFLDGVRDIGQYNRDLFATEYVEVLKGPSALMFGRGSTGGVINQVPKTADLLPRNEAAVTLGSFDTKRASYDLNLRLGEASAFRVAALAENSGSFRYPQDADRLGVAPSLRFGIGTGTDVTLSYWYLKTRDVTDYGQPNLGATFGFALPPVDVRKYYGFANHDYTELETHIATFRIDHRISEAVSLRNTLRWANYRREMEATIPSLSTTDANGAPVTAATPVSLLRVNRTHDASRSRDNDDGVLINQTELTWKLSTGGIRHTLLGGVELARERLDRHTNALDANPAAAGIQAPAATTPLLDPDPYTTLSYTKAPLNRNFSRADSIAAYAQDQLELSKQWKALLGLRWERYAASTEQTALHPNGTAAGPFARTDSYLSGRAGLMWQPTGVQAYYVSWGNAYNPSGELGVYGASGTNLSAINDDLGPEKTVNYELGGQWDFAGGLRIRSALFRTEKTNARMADPSNAAVNILAGKRRVDGLELEAQGSLARNWDLFAAYALMDGRIVKGPANVQGKEVPLPEHSGSIWTLYRLGGGWQLGGGALFSSARWIDDQNRARIPSYVRWDATLGYIQKKYDVQLNGYNLTDKKYYLGGYENGANRVLPAAPRTVMLTLRYRFD
jgi:catecholate siderophore receptor